MVQSRCSRAQSRYSCRWRLVNTCKWVGCLLCILITNSVLLTVLRKNSTWICILFGYQLLHFLPPILLEQMGMSPMSIFLDNAWRSNVMVSTDKFNIIHPLCIITNNGRSRRTWSLVVSRCSFLVVLSLKFALYQSSLDPQPFPSDSE